MNEAVTSSAEPEETGGRLGALDAVRVVMVFCVIAFRRLPVCKRKIERV